MASVLILCPTFDHAETLFASTASVRTQAFRDWELVVVGDGAPDRTATIMAAIGRTDARIRYEPHPKSERFGEIYRDRIIRESKAEVVLQLGDDDLWAPDHIDCMLELLRDAEWANEAPLRVAADGTAEWWPINHGTRQVRSAIVRGVAVSAGPNFVGYRRDAYLRLPEGWTCAPRPGPSDAYMWAKFFNCRRLSWPVPQRPRPSNFRVMSPAERTSIPATGWPNSAAGWPAWPSRASCDACAPQPPFGHACSPSTRCTMSRKRPRQRKRFVCAGSSRRRRTSDPPRRVMEV